MRRLLPAILAAFLLAAAPAADPPPDIFLTEPARSPLAEATKAEQQTLARLLAGETWPRRAVAAMRLERYDCEPSAARLTALLADPAWQVRAYAIRALVRRREAVDPARLATEENPRVVRTALRYRLPIPPERIARGVRQLARSADPFDRMLAVEIGAASADPELLELASETCNRLIMRMNRPLGGALSARIAAVTGSPDQRSAFRWRRWRLKIGRSFGLVPVHLIDDGLAAAPLSGIAALEPNRFAALEDYIQELSSRRLDLAIVIDCTASMSGELQVAQGGIDDLLVFTGDVAEDLRFGLVAYRDRRDRDFETKAWDFTRSIDAARAALWSLSADGGGDRAEMVYPAIMSALTDLAWSEERTKVLVIVGDAPPHVGKGLLCVDLVRRASEKGLVTHVIRTEQEEVEHFAAIAEAGNGRLVGLEDDANLIVEIAGLTVGDVFEVEMAEFFRAYLELCR